MDVNGEEAMMNKQLLWENSLSFNESTAYRLSFNMFTI